MTNKTMRFRARTIKVSMVLAINACISLLVSCATTGTGSSSSVVPPFLNAKQAQLESSTEPYVRDNIGTFHTFVLKNGIPVVVKINPANRIFNVRLVLKGGLTLASPEKAGLERLMLQTMTRGSHQYPWEKLASLLDATSSSIDSGSGADASSYSLNTLDTYFERVFPAWADTLIAPEFSDRDFELMRQNALQGIEGEEQDPWATLNQEMNHIFFANHPYGIRVEGSSESLSGIKIDEVKDWYRSHFSADRMMVIAVGNFDIEKLRKNLESTIGTIPRLSVAVPTVASISSVPNTNPGGLFKRDFPRSKGLAYLLGTFPAPIPGTPDFPAANLASKMYSDILFQVVRSRHSAVYSPDAGIAGGMASYGMISMFKSSVPDQLKPLMDQALQPLLEGKCLASGSASSSGSHIGVAESNDENAGELKLESIADALPTYKAQYINEIFESRQTNAAIAAQIQSSSLIYGDFRAYLLSMDRVNSVNADQVQRVATELFAKQKITWGLLGDKALIDTVDPAQFK